MENLLEDPKLFHIGAIVIKLLPILKSINNIFFVNIQKDNNMGDLVGNDKGGFVVTRRAPYKIILVNKKYSLFFSR